MNLPDYVGDGQRRVLVVLNPAAGQSSLDEVRRILAATFEAAGWQYRLHELAKNDDLSAVIEEAKREGSDLVVAAGGDGTVSLVADHLVGSETSLGILPLGTGNVLSLALGIPQDLPQAAALLVGAHRLISLDAMRIGARHFFLNAGIGLPARVMRDTARVAKRRFGMLAYAYIALRNLLSQRPQRISLEVDGRRQRLRASLAMVLNAGELGSTGLRWAEGIRVDDGQLDLVVWKARGLGDYLRLARELVFDLPGPRSTIQRSRISKEATITASRELPVQADGEVIGSSRSLQVRVVPRALWVIVPGVAPESFSGGETLSEEQRRQVGRIRRALGRLLGPVGKVDSAAFAWTSSLPHPPVLTLPLRALSAIMSKGIAWALGLFLASRLDPGRGRRAARDVLPTMWLAGLTVELLLKRLFSRARPFTTLAVAEVVGNRPSGYSFPSAHTAVSFAAAWLLGPHYPRLAAAFYALAALVGFSRLYLGVHYLSDVVTGAASGVALAAAYHYLIGGRFGRRS